MGNVFLGLNAMNSSIRRLLKCMRYLSDCLTLVDNVHDIRNYKRTIEYEEVFLCKYICILFLVKTFTFEFLSVKFRF